MLELQKERLKRLLSTAILQLWKKETGSLASVLIEGTICITAAGGRTTVIQVGDRFVGAIPEGYGAGVGVLAVNKKPSMPPFAVPPLGWAGVDTRPPPHIHCPNPTAAVAMASYFEELSPASLVSPTGDSVPVKEEEDCHTPEADDSEETAVEALAQLSTERKSGGVCPGTGYYTRREESDSSSDEDVPHRPSSALDLSRRDSDLALSPPHSYTAQVRDVIRQRLLAGRPPVNVSLKRPLEPSRWQGLVAPVAVRSDVDGPAGGSGASAQTSDPPADIEKEGEQKVYYKCEYCVKSFLFKSKYQEHLPVHTNARPYRCPQCARTYKYKYDLRVHLRTHMGIPTKSTVCPFCAARCDTNKLLRLHIRDRHADGGRMHATPTPCGSTGPDSLMTVSPQPA